MQPELAVSLDDAQAIIKELEDHEICPRCILRMIGVKTQWDYRQPEKVRKNKNKQEQQQPTKQSKLDDSIYNGNIL